MRKQFSESSELFINFLGEVSVSWYQLNRELSEILESVRSTMAARGWITKSGGEPTSIIQMSRENWPCEWGGVHYEVWFDENIIRQGIIQLFLHIENEVPSQLHVIKKMRELMKPFMTNIVASLKEYNGSILAGPIHEILRVQFELSRLHADTIIEALSAMMEIESLVDEALLLAEGSPLWRTDFLTGQPRPNLKFNNSTGGQTIISNAGRLGSGSILIDGTKTGNHEIYDSRPTHIMLLDRLMKLSEGQSVYFACTVRTKVGARIWFYGEGPKEPVGFPPLLKDPSFPYIDIPGNPDRWQAVRYPSPGEKAVIQSYEKGPFADTGAFIYLRTQTKDTELKIGSIEFGIDE